MVLFNYSTKEITAKIVYYGPGLCGKTTNLQFIYDALPSNSKSKMLSLATKADRTLFFDFLPLDLGRIRGMRTRMQLYTVPGQVYYNSTRQLVLKGADGVVFVADSQADLVDANIESWNNLKDNLKKQGVDFRKLPIVIQYNKRDIPGVLPVEELDAQINELNVPFFESVATSGIGVEDSLKGIVRLVLKDLMARYGLSGDVSEDEIAIGARPSASMPTPAPSEAIWQDESRAIVEDDVQEVPFLIPEAPGQGVIDEPGASVEVVELGPGESAGIVEAQVEIVDARPAARTSPPLEDETDIVFDTLPDAAVSSAPTPLPADSLVVALGGAAERQPPQRPSGVPPLPAGLEAPAVVPAPAPVPPPAPAAVPRPSVTTAVPAPPRPTATVPHDPGILVKEVSIPLNLSVDEMAGKKRIVVRIQLEVNLLR